MRTRDDLLAGARLHGLDGVAGIDRPLECVGADHLQDFGNLRHVQLCGHARQIVFSVGRGRRQNGVIVAGKRQDQRLHRLGEHFGVERIVGDQHFLHAGDFRGRLGDGAAILARDQDMDAAPSCGGRRDRLCGRVLQSLVVVLGNDERGHQITPASCSLASNSATVFTLTPRLALGRLGDLQHFQARRDVDAVIGRASFRRSAFSSPS